MTKEDSVRGAPPDQREVRDQVPVRIAPLPHGEGARRMAERLRARFDSFDWRSDPNKPFERISYLEALLNRHPSLHDRLVVGMVLGNEQLRAGRSDNAIDTFEALVKLVDQHTAEVPRKTQAELHQELALAYLYAAAQK